MSEAIVGRCGSVEGGSTTFKLNSREIVEDSKEQPYTASRNAIAKALRRRQQADLSAIITVDYRVRYDWGYSSPLDARVHIGKDFIALGCQYFIGEEARKL